MFNNTKNRRMNFKSLLYLLTIALFISSCGDGERKPGKRDAKGDVVLGGVFNFADEEPFQTLYPAALTDIGSAQLAAQIHDGLLRFNPKDMSVDYRLAKDYSISNDGKVYTFNLRENVKFHDDECFNGKGRKVTAHDVKYSFELLCENTPDNFNFSGTFQDKVVGANAYFKGSADEVEGFKVIDDFTFEIHLTRPNNTFLYILSNSMTSIIPKEGVEMYGAENKVGLGAFRFADFKEDPAQAVLVRNLDYYLEDTLGNQLPYLDTVVVHYVNSKNQQLSMFREGDIHIIIGLPSDKIKDVVEEQIADFSNVPPKFILGRNPEMVTSYYEFNLTREHFQDVRVRQAFSYAINRDKIVDDILKGEAYGPGIHGITPPTFRGYDITQVGGYNYDPQRAKELFAEAGYPNGKGFPTLKLVVNSGGAKNTKVAFEIQKQLLEVLNVNLDIDVVSFAKKNELAQEAKADIVRAGWVADYPSPESFLWVFYGKNVPESTDEISWPNSARYVNDQYDKLYEKGISTLDKEESYGYFLEAEKIMMQDAPAIILWYNENYRLVQSDVRNFFSNPLNFIDFTSVYLKERTGEVKGG